MILTHVSSNELVFCFCDITSQFPPDEEWEQAAIHTLDCHDVIQALTLEVRDIHDEKIDLSKLFLVTPPGGKIIRESRDAVQQEVPEEKNDSQGQSGVGLNHPNREVEIIEISDSEDDAEISPGEIARVAKQLQ